MTASPTPVLQIIIANTPMGQSGLPVAQWFGERAREHAGFEVRLVDLAETHLDSTIVDAADAFVFVVADDEGTNAASKVVTDSVDFQWQYKPLGVISHGDRVGGPPVVQAIKDVLALLGMTRIDQSIAIDDVGERIEAGQFVGTDAMEDSAKAMLDELWCLDPFLDALRTWAAVSEAA
jgi:NAD(P)H-dependent FMN reductase